MHFDSDLIILDEPTVALAISEVRKVLDFVRSIKTSGRACIYIEHNLAHVHELADRLVVLDRGRIVADIRSGEMSLEQLTTFLIDLQHSGHAVGPA
jgi:simple sugar transport system ATP-binding protein